MNKQIKELEKQCWSHCIGGYVIEGQQHFDSQKFAELIVRECISIVESLPTGYQDYRNQIEDSFRRDCVATLKQRLGVEK